MITDQCMPRNLQGSRGALHWRSACQAGPTQLQSSTMYKAKGFAIQIHLVHIRGWGQWFRCPSQTTYCNNLFSKPQPPVEPLPDIFKPSSQHTNTTNDIQVTLIKNISCWNWRGRILLKDAMIIHWILHVSVETVHNFQQSSVEVV